MTKQHVNVAIAVSSPIISSGLKMCLMRMTDSIFNVVETSGYRELVDACNMHDIHIIIVNPSFGGIFNPNSFRNEVPHLVRLILIETGPVDEHSRKLYDQSIGVMDDLMTIESKIRKILNTDSQNIKSKDLLSLREKEIVALVVKGMTNKEIADKLFISVHTVITHRRNIARKLEIHSATGLTIYAIVNHLVDISDIRI